MTTPRMFRLNVEVSDLAAAAEFYSRLFDTEARPQMGSRIYVPAGDVTLQVVAVAEPQLLPKALYFATDQLDAVHARAAALDCLATDDVHGTPASEPVVRPWGERSFYCADPSGNPLCFVDSGTIYAG